MGAAFLLAQLGAHAAGRYAVRVAELELDPAQTGDYLSDEAIYLVFPGLVASDSKLNVTPWAAERLPDISGDGMTYTFHIRAGLRWSDGAHIDASTFAYSLNRSLSPCQKRAGGV